MCTSCTLRYIYDFQHFMPLLPLGTSPNLSPVASSSNGFLSSVYHRSPVEFPDTADFLTKSSVNMHKSVGCTVSPSDYQQQLRTSSHYTCSR